MRKSVIAPLMLAAVVLVQGLTFAATPERELPPEVAGHVSVRSLRGFIRNVDRYIAAASKDSENEIPSGFLSMMAMIYLPVPMDDWNSDGPMNVVILDAPTTAEMPYVVYFQAPDFAKLTETLAESGWTVEDAQTDGGDGYKEVRPIVMPGGEQRVMADLGDGRVAVAEKLEDLRTVRDYDWFPSHLADADLHANVALKNKDNPLTKLVRDLIEEKKGELVENVGDMGFNPAFAKGVGDFLEKYGPLAAAEADKARYLLLEIRFAENIATVDIGAKFEPGSLGGQVAEGVEKSGALDLSLAARIPADADSIAVSYPATRVLPDAPATVAKFAGEAMETLIPGMGDEVTKTFEAFYAAKPGQAVSGSYFRDGGNHSISYLPVEKPEEALEAVAKTIGVMNKAWTRIINDPEEGFELVENREQANGAPLLHFTQRFTNPEKFRELMDRIHAVDPNFSVSLDPDNRLDLYLTTDKGGIIFGAGELSRDEFDAAVRHMANPEGKNIFQSPAAEKLLGRIEYGQGSIGVMDPIGLFGIYVNAAAQVHDSRYGQPESNPYRIAMEKIDLANTPAKSAIAFALGADKGWIVNRIFVPSTAVNEVARLYDEYTRLHKEAAEDLNVPDEIDVPEEYEDDMEEEMEEAELGDEDAA